MQIIDINALWYLTAFQFGLVCAWAVIKGMSDD
jgi:hypothetical protein